MQLLNYVDDKYDIDFSFVFSFDLTDTKYIKDIGTTYKSDYDLKNEIKTWLYSNIGYSTITINGKCIYDQAKWTYIIYSNYQNPHIIISFKNKTDAMNFKLVWS